MENNKIKELLKIAKKEYKKNPISPRKFERTEDGVILLNPNKKFDKEWYENDEDYDLI